MAANQAVTDQLAIQYSMSALSQAKQVLAQAQDILTQVNAAASAAASSAATAASLSLAVGSVAGGSTAYASIGGSGLAKILNLVLPQGAQGEPGDPGPQGPQGEQGFPGPQGQPGTVTVEGLGDVATQSDIATFSGNGIVTTNLLVQAISTFLSGLPFSTPTDGSDFYWDGQMLATTATTSSVNYGAGSSSSLPSLITNFFASLPTTEPSTSGVLWWNGHVLARS